MGFDFGANAKDKVQGGAQAVKPVTNLSEHVDGGENPVSGAKAVTTADQDMVMYGGAAVIVGSIALLWFMGAIAFRGLPSL